MSPSRRFSHETANTDFGSTLTFATTGDVFNLPSGYTANSAQAGIVDNHFIPEPSATLGALGLVMIPLLRSRPRVSPTR